MALLLKLSTTVRNARLDQIETTIGATPVLQIWSGTIPANCAAADAGDGALLVSINLPADWMAAAAGGAKAKLGAWSGLGLAAAGAGVDATHFRLKVGATCHIQGTVGESGDTPDMVLDNKNIAQNQTVTITTFTITDGNA
jgi:hypothetical protein